MNNMVSLAPLEQDFLAHSRTKGSKNGVRLYQYEDGTYTELGKARRRKGYDSDYERTLAAEKRYRRHLSTPTPGIKSSRAIDTDRLFEQTIKTGKDRPNKSPAEKITDETEEIISGVSRISSTVAKVRSSGKREEKVLSDEELRKRISRLELERRYADLSSLDVTRGKITASDILDTAGDLIGIVGGVATIIGIVKKLKS